MVEFTRILTPVDFSGESHHALVYAIRIARWYESRIAVLHVYVNRPAVNIIPSVYPVALAPVDFETMRNDLSARTRMFVDEVHAHDVPIDIAVAEAGSVHREILAQARRLSADLIVMATHGVDGLERLVLGSTTEKVLRQATMCPVMVVPPRAPETPATQPVQFRRILCPVDFSDSSLTALTYAMSLAEEADAQLTLLHAIEMVPELYDAPWTPAINLETLRETVEAERLQRLQALVPDAVREFCTVHTTIVEGRASRAILRVAAERDADLIVMGVHGRGVFDLMLFGSNTHHIVRAASCPVLTVRAHEAAA